jgi:hypothetical protein
VRLVGGAPAAEVTVEGGEVTAMNLVFRQYSATEESVDLLPELQAFAAAGGEFELCYFDAGGEALSPEWAVSAELRERRPDL